MNSKTLLVSLAVLVVLVGGFFIYEKFTAPAQNQTQAINNQTNTLPQTTPTTPPTTGTPATTGFKDGTYLGDETSSIYGKAKVQVVILNGKITDVQFVEFPNGKTATIMKSNMAMPIIKQEVISAQSANVNTVSGATQTADSFIQSIASALSKASAS